MLILKNKSIINVFSKQYPVGQGGLHLSIITLINKNPSKPITRYAYIYDCGDCTGNNAKNVKPQIDNLINDIKTYSEFCTIEASWCILCNIDLFNKIDDLIIFISHLHEDHYNGFEYLKQKLKESNVCINQPKLILPYMTDLEKDIMIRDCNYHGQNKDFINNPENSYGDSFDIYYLTDEDKYYRKEDPFKNNTLPCDKNNNNFKLDFIEDNGKRFINHNSMIWINTTAGSWVLRMYYHKMPETIIMKIREKLDLNFTNASNKVLKTCKKIYEDTLGKKSLNHSSICLYSGPYKDCYGEGFLHTGDIELISNNTDFINFKRHHNQYLSNVCIAQIPHHGSKHNSCLKSFKIFNNLKLLYITKEVNPNGHKQPRLNIEYKNKKFIKEVTSEISSELTFFNFYSLDYSFIHQKPIFNYLSNYKTNKIF